MASNLSPASAVRAVAPITRGLRQAWIFLQEWIGPGGGPDHEGIETFVRGFLRSLVSPGGGPDHEGIETPKGIPFHVARFGPGGGPDHEGIETGSPRFLP